MLAALHASGELQRTLGIPVGTDVRRHLNFSEVPQTAPPPTTTRRVNGHSASGVQAIVVNNDEVHSEVSEELEENLMKGRRRPNGNDDDEDEDYFEVLSDEGERSTSRRRPNGVDRQGRFGSVSDHSDELEPRPDEVPEESRYALGRRTPPRPNVVEDSDASIEIIAAPETPIGRKTKARGKNASKQAAVRREFWAAKGMREPGLAESDDE